MMPADSSAANLASITAIANVSAVLGDFLNQLDHRPPQAIVVDARECLQQSIGMWLRQLVKDRLLVGVPHLVAALEQGGDWDSEEYCNLQQSAAADAIGSLLVFLDLLEREFELVGKLGLGEPLLQTIDADIAADDPVDRIRSF